MREYDPASFELVMRSTERFNDPRRYFVELLRTIRHLYAERSGGMHGLILDRMNHFVRLPDGGPIRGISVALTPEERERYRAEEVNLAELPDRSDFLAELDRILELVTHEIDFEGQE
jgi:hypothetical protein